MSTKLTVPALCSTIKVLIAKGDHASEKAEQFYITAGLHLIDLHKRKPKDIAWPEYVRAKVGIGKSRAYELAQIANGRTTVEKVRARGVERIKKFRANRPLRNGQDDESRILPPGVTSRINDSGQREYDLGPDADREYKKTMETARRDGFLQRAHEAVHLAEYDASPDGLKNYAELAEAAERAADAWGKMATTLKAKLRRGG